MLELFGVHVSCCKIDVVELHIIHLLIGGELSLLIKGLKRRKHITGSDRLSNLLPKLPPPALISPPKVIAITNKPTILLLKLQNLLLEYLNPIHLLVFF